MTLSCLLGGEKAIDRPMVKLKLHGAKNEEKFLYDSGAQVSLMTDKTFRKIKVGLRPEKIKFKLNCSGVSGSKLKVTGCYFFNFTILGEKVKHPIFVVDKIPGQAGVLGIDMIKRLGLGLDVITNEPYFINKSNLEQASLTKDIIIPARSRQVCKVKIPSKFINEDENLQVLSISVPSSRQIFPDEVLIKANKEGVAKVYITNSSYSHQQLKRGQNVGEVMSVSADEINRFPVSDTTPWTIPDDKKIKAPPLDDNRRKKILSMAHLEHLDPDLKVKYTKLLLKNHACISINEFDLGSCNKGAHSIPTKRDSPPSYQKQFPLPIEHAKEIKRQILEWLKIGIIRPCESEYNSSLFLVRKKSPPAKQGDNSPQPQKFRVVQDLRALNKETIQSNVRLPEIHECLDRIAGKKPTVFSSLDLRSGYYQLPISRESQEKTAFTCPNTGQQYCFNVTSQGLTSAPASFARVMKRIFSKQVIRNDLEVYLDDILAYSKDHNEMLKTLDEAMKNLIDAGMKINIEKCQFGIKKLTYLGFELDKDGYRPDPLKSEGITKVHEPSTLKGVRSFMGMANFYRLLIPKFAQLTKPLTKLTCKNAWSGGELPKEAKAAFKKCQEIFTKRPFLHYPDFNLKFHLFVDASLGDQEEAKEGGLAGCLVQYPDNDVTKPMRPIGFCSRGLQKHEKNYSAHLIESAGIIYAIEFFEKYLRTRFTCHTDHKPLTTIKEGKVHKRTLERFREILADYDFTLEYEPGEKIPADFMSRHVKVFQFDIHSVNLIRDKLKVFSKELSKGEKLHKPIKSGLETSENAVQSCANSIACNNSAQEPAKNLQARVKEYWGLAQAAAVQALRAEETVQAEKSKLAHSDSGRPGTDKGDKIGACNTKPTTAAAETAQSVARQRVESGAKVKNTCNEVPQTETPAVVKSHAAINLPKTLTATICEAKSKLRNLKKFCAYGVKGKLTSFNFLDTATDKNPRLLKHQQSMDPFIQAIKYFITDKVLPAHRYRNIIKRFGPNCFEKKGFMFLRYAREGYPTRDLIIAPGERIANIIAEAHSSLLGGHDSTQKTVERILTEYWFPGVYSEVQFFIDNCPTCQRIKKKSKLSNTLLKPLKQPDQIFERVHIDLFGPLKTPEGKAYISSKVDAYSKFAIFSVIPDKEATTVAKDFFDNWIAIFGSPLVVVSDRGTDFHTKTMQKVCEYLQIDKRVISAKHPQANSQIEILNKKLAKYLTAMEKSGAKDWQKLVTSCQYAYNLSVHKAMKSSPYNILFGLDPNTPLNSKGFVTTPIYGDTTAHRMALRLKLARKLAKENNMKFREDYRKRFNQKVDLHDFKEGMVVLLHRPEQIKVNPKIQSPWFGPYLILSMIGTSNALIQDIGNKKTRFVNTNRLREYNSTIAEWEKGQAQKSKKKNKSVDAQDEEKGDNNHFEAKAGPPLRWTDFDLDNDVAILNPEALATHRPIPDPPHIKEEIEGGTESVAEEEPLELDQDDQASEIPANPSSPAIPHTRESMSDTLQNLLPTFGKPKPKHPMTRHARKSTNQQLKDESGTELLEKLKVAEGKRSKKSQNPNKKK